MSDSTKSDGSDDLHPQSGVDAVKSAPTGAAATEVTPENPGTASGSGASPEWAPASETMPAVTPPIPATDSGATQHPGPDRPSETPAAPTTPSEPVPPTTPLQPVTPEQQTQGQKAPDDQTPHQPTQNQAVASDKKTPKRNSNVGIIAALAVGALVGGVSGGGAALWALQNDDKAAVESASASTNITVNDPNNATVITAVAAKAAASIVTIAVSGNGAVGSGSGVILTDDGYVLTNAHVATLSGGTSDPALQVQTFDGRLFSATLIGSDPIADLAVIKIESEEAFEPAEFADSSQLNVGDTAVAIGAPLGLANTVTNGIVSALNRSITVASSAAPETDDAPTPDQNDGNGPFDFWEFDNRNQEGGSQPASSTIALPVIQTDAAINPGNSGGALLDSDGRVIGINVAIARTGNSSQATPGSIGVGFSIPANYAERVAKELIEDGSASHGLLGATVADVTEDTGIKSSATVGASIQEISPGGAAAQARLQPGDVITRFNGSPITGRTDLTAQVRVLAGGSDAELTYVRDGESSTVTVTLGEL